MTAIYDQLCDALTEAGLPANTTKYVKGASITGLDPIAAIVNTEIDAAPYAGILLKYAVLLTAKGEVEMVARCMAQNKGFKDAVPWLLSLFSGFPENGMNESSLWAIGNSIYTINDKRYYDEVIEICAKKKYGDARQNLMGSLARAKTDKAYEVLLDCLEESGLRGHAIESLGRFGRVAAIEILEPLTVKKDRYEFKARNTALRRLRRKL